ncbi:hypothetical protein D3J93_18385 [Salmonella enterica]|uniref:Uncharacterized protein n=1 Tax=Salmonella enterica TaxID=28901 RepID=A0A5T3MYZ4_SALER|nr:hypothetical protein [Salmonella enterica]EAT4240014.1 hypothetical protein [Salmonella enterica]EBL2504085.1 hypothetical protein [Salmonella enterica]
MIWVRPGVFGMCMAKPCAAWAGGWFALIWVLQNDARVLIKGSTARGEGKVIKNPVLWTGFV